MGRAANNRHDRRNDEHCGARAWRQVHAEREVAPGEGLQVWLMIHCYSRIRLVHLHRGGADAVASASTTRREVVSGRAVPVGGAWDDG